MPKFNKLLILDLDETLVYATEKKLERDPDFLSHDYFVYKRPGLDKFLENCLNSFDVGIWTASGEIYAADVLKNIFGDINKLKVMLTNEHCVRRYNHDEGCHYNIKDLKKVVKKTDHPLEQIIIVDDSKEKVERNYGNAIIVKEYNGELEDDELPMLIQYLYKIGNVESIRGIDKRKWRNNI